MTDSDLLWAMDQLKLDTSLLQTMTDARRPLDVRTTAWRSLQAATKATFKKAALDLHPDRTGGDVAKTNAFKRLTAFVDLVEALPPPEPVRHVIGKFRTSVRL